MKSHTTQSIIVVGLSLLSEWCFAQQPADPVDTICNGINFGAVPHPTDCQQYYVCFQSKAVVNRCPTDFVFKPSVSFCVHRSQYRCPGDVPTTTAAPQSSTVEPSTPNDCPEVSWETHFCWNHASDLIRNPVNCTQYIDCELSRPSNRECPTGQVFSLPYQDCFPGNVFSCQLEPVEETFCAARPTGTYPHPYQCNRFVTCFRGEPRVETCPPYYLFDAVTQRCAKGDVLQCSSLLV